MLHPLRQQARPDLYGGIMKEQLLELLEQVENQSGDWRVALEQATAMVRGADALETVIFQWSTSNGKCYECGLPAWYRVPDAYGPDSDQEHPKHLRCSVCAAGDAAHGERIVWLGTPDSDCGCETTTDEIMELLK
jgi:hypothetical protein